MYIHFHTSKFHSEQEMLPTTKYINFRVKTEIDTHTPSSVIPRKLSFALIVDFYETLRLYCTSKGIENYSLTNLKQCPCVRSKAGTIKEKDDRY